MLYNGLLRFVVKKLFAQDFYMLVVSTLPCSCVEDTCVDVCTKLFSLHAQHHYD